MNIGLLEWFGFGILVIIMLVLDLFVSPV